jgi:calreticulin
MRALAIFALLVLVALVQGKIYYHEAFDSDSAWQQSEKKDDFGKLTISSGAFFGDEKINQGYKTSEDAKFYASSAQISNPVTNEGKNIVVSLSVKHEQGIDCGGGYIKLMPKTASKEFNGESEYWMMFGPDICGYSKKIHLIFNYKGQNLLWKKEPRCEDDKFTHVYTVVVKPDNTYEVYVDQTLKESGKMEDDWAFLKPKEIDDPSDKKPSDWVDEPEMDDANDKKPDDWDAEPATIADPDAKQPEDWDEGEDGKWEPPQIPNPKHKGEWRPKRIPNPKYKGEWKPKQIPNPDYVADDKLYKIGKPLETVGIDVWQVKSGTIFDNIVIGDDLDEVNKIVDATWKATKDAEKKASEAAEKKDDTKKDDEEDKKEDDAKEDL